MAACCVLASAATAVAADTTPPVTSDDVSSYRTSSMRVTLAATDEPGGSGVATTVFTTGAMPAQPTVLSPVYDPADKPILADGERISYFSIDVSGNTEALRTSKPLVVAPATTRYERETFSAVGSRPQSVAVEDVTGDGRPDMVVALAAGGTVLVMPRNAAGTGWNPPSSAGTTGGYPTSVAVGDVTGDGRADIVTADSMGNSVTVISRSSDGDGWATPTPVGTGGSVPQSVAVEDVTGDHRPDLIVAHSGSNNVSVIARSNGNDGWDDPTLVATAGSSPASVAAEDVTGDGRPDLITANYASNDVSVIARDSTGTGWEPASIAGPTGAGPRAVAVGDVTGDGRPDLVTADSADGSVSVFARNSTNTDWESPTATATSGSRPLSVALADVTGDGRLDLITANVDSHDVSVIARDGDGWGSATIAGTTGAYPASVAVADVNDDGRPDLITANEGDSLTVLTARFDDTTPPVTTDDVPATYRTTPVPVTLSASDDEPGGSGVATTFFTTGTDPEAPTASSARYDPAHKPTLADGERIAYYSVDQAGNPETVKRSRPARVAPATNFYVSQVAGVTGGSPSSVAVADVTDDGILDLITARASADNVSVIARDAPGTAWNSPTNAGATGRSPVSMAVGDVTGDGRPDLVTANTGSNDVTVIARNAAGTDWDPPSSVNIHAQPAAVAIDDVTGDGQPDLVTANGGNSNVSVVARDAAGTGWDPPSNVDLDAQPGWVAVGDVTGDGQPDLVTANYASSNLSVVARNAAGTDWDPPSNVHIDAQPTSVAIDDVTGDGRPDLVTVNSGNGHGRDTVTVVARNAVGSGWDPPTTAGPTGRQPTSVAVADVTGDGQPDLITANYFGNDVTVIPRDAAGTGWGPPSTADSGGDGPSSVAVADVTDDGRPDLIVANSESGNVAVLAAGYDGVAPATADDVPAGYRTEPVPVTLTASDDPDGSGVAHTFFTIGTDPETPTASSATYDPAHKPTLTDGEKIAYYSVDKAGNAEGVQVSSAARVDQTAPTTNDDVDSRWHAQPVSVSLTATDGGSGVEGTYYTVGTEPATPTTASAEYAPDEKPVLNDGERIAYFSVDAAGNAEQVRTSSAAQVDSTVPDTTITAGPAELGNDPRPSIAFASAAVDVRFECALDDDAFAGCASPFQPAAAVADGEHRVRVRALSRADLIDPSPAELAFTVDTAAPPAPVLLGGPPAAASETTVSIGFATEPDATATCSVDGTPFAPCASPLTLTGLSVGDHAVRIVQTDAAGNAGPALRIPFTVTAKPTETPIPNEAATPGDTAKPPVDSAPNGLSLGTGLSRDTTGRVPAVFRADRATLGCRVDTGLLQRCVAVARSTRTLTTRGGRSLPKGTVLARGSSRTGIAAAPSLVAELRLTAAARGALASHPLGLTARVTTTGTATTGQAIEYVTLLRLVRDDRLVLPVGAATNGTLSAGNKKMLARLVRTVGNAKAVRCAAYTDTTRTAAAAQALTRTQAQAACRYLAQRGLKAKQTVQGHGSSRPRASNATAKGRAKNRRLEITITV